MLNNRLQDYIIVFENAISNSLCDSILEEFKNSERYNVDNDAVNIEDGLDNFATSSVLNPDRAFQSFVERKPNVNTVVSNSNDSHLQFKKVKEKKQDTMISPPSSSTRFLQPKPQNSKITSPYNLSSLAAKSPINSIFRSINAKVNDSFENKNKKIRMATFTLLYANHVFVKYISTFYIMYVKKEMDSLYKSIFWKIAIFIIIPISIIIIFS